MLHIIWNYPKSVQLPSPHSQSRAERERVLNWTIFAQLKSFWKETSIWSSLEKTLWVVVEDCGNGFANQSFLPLSICLQSLLPPQGVWNESSTFLFQVHYSSGYSLEPNICSYKHFFHVISCNGNQKFSRQALSLAKQKEGHLGPLLLPYTIWTNLKIVSKSWRIHAGIRKGQLKFIWKFIFLVIQRWYMSFIPSKRLKTTSSSDFQSYVRCFLKDSHTLK